MNGSDESSRTDSTGVAPPIRILEHNLIDICDLLEATFGLDGVDVTFSRRSAGVDRRWQGQLGDWLVADSNANWFVVSDAEFGRLRSGPAGDRTEPGRQVVDVPTVEPRIVAP
jgi:hypothetical protein